MPDTRLIEKWLPIHELGIESERERTPMTPFPAPNRLHVWWARRPLVASRAAILGSLLPEDSDRSQFLHALGIHGDPVQAKKDIARARSLNQRFKKDPYGYRRAFTWNPLDSHLIESRINENTLVLDPTSGGGSVPFEAARLGIGTYANDLNPVATLLLKATVEWPFEYGNQLLFEYESVRIRFVAEVERRLKVLFAAARDDTVDVDYLWARTVSCPHCDGLVPLSPNWRIAPGGLGIKLIPQLRNGPNSSDRICKFEIVRGEELQSEGTVARGRGMCPYTDCGRVIEGDQIRSQAKEGQMGEQLYAVVYKTRIKTYRKDGSRGRDKWERGYRTPTDEDDNLATAQKLLSERLPDWEMKDVVPSERIPIGLKTREPLNYGMPYWRDLFNPRQLFSHGTSVEVFREFVSEDETNEKLTEIRRAAYGYLALAIDKSIDYNNRSCLWISQREVIGHRFDQHNFAMKWSYAEMAQVGEGSASDWASSQISKCIKELVQLTQQKVVSNVLNSENRGIANHAPLTISCSAADSLEHIPDASIDVIVMDPPYYDNVMYAELSDFFYVWLKRTAGLIVPDLFQRRLTDKDNEAVANPALFKDQEKPTQRAAEDYQLKMQYIFEECRRLLKPNGIMTVMFNHKATGAWDALAKGLLEADFTITASWPVASEAEGSLHIRDKAAVRSTIFLVCRPKETLKVKDGQQVNIYWEDIEPKVVTEIRQRVKEFENAGIGGVDLYLSCFGPALKVLSEHWPLTRGQPRPKLTSRRGGKREPHIVDPYAVLPEDALTTARQAVQHWRLEKLAGMNLNQELDELTGFFVLAWDTFRAPNFEYDEALQLSRAVGVDLDSDIVGRIALKKGSQIHLLDSGDRVNRVSMGQPDLNSSMLDILHRAAFCGRTESLEKAREMLEGLQLTQSQEFKIALKAVLEVLPPSTRFTDIELKGDLVQAASDFDALMQLNQLMYGEQAMKIEQLDVLEPEKV